MSDMHLEIGDVAVGTKIQTVKVDPRLRQKIPTGIGYFDFILSGEVKERGLTPSEVIMMTGGAGAGKTTLLLQMASSLAKAEHTVLVIGNEESAAQMRMTYERLKLDGDFTIGSCYFMDVTGKKDIDDAIFNKRTKQHNTFKTHYEVELAKHVAANKKRGKGNEKWMVVFVDSLQTLNCGKWGWKTNSNTPQRVLAQLCAYAKRDFVCFIIIGQVTKNDEFAGKNVLKHMCDGFVELTIDKDAKSPTVGCRLLECTKHRFGPAGLTMVLDIKAHGLVEHGSFNAGL
jgi:DNA repair protein RadA/Sms